MADEKINVEDLEEQEPELKDQVISIRRVTKVVKGGKNLSFSALVAAGNGKGRIGIGKGKAREVPMAIAKAVENAKKNNAIATNPAPNPGIKLSTAV